ncbi:cupin domain-containing protein [Candidatus Pacearchaeota archaeon]|nr:cupin domain-containing protein [Candidatus Pacearchaeota archaeon]
MLDLTKYIRNWKNAEKNFSHGNMTEYLIFTKSDSLTLDTPGAILQYIKRFSRLVLDPKTSSLEVVHPEEQEIFYVVNGEAKIVTNKKKEKLKKGCALFIPANVSHRFVNKSTAPLELLAITEDVSPDKKVKKDILIRKYQELPVAKMPDGSLYHWTHYPRTLFSREDGLHKIHYVSIVDILDPNKWAEPHAHIQGTDEVWYALNGSSNMRLGNEIIFQEPGKAIMIPPDSETVHSSKPIKTSSFFFFLYTPTLEK